MEEALDRNDILGNASNFEIISPEEPVEPEEEDLIKVKKTLSLIVRFAL